MAETTPPPLLTESKKKLFFMPPLTREDSINHTNAQMESVGYKEGREYVLEFTSAGNVIGYINPYLLSECTSKRKI